MLSERTERQPESNCVGMDLPRVEHHPLKCQYCDGFAIH